MDSASSEHSFPVACSLYWVQVPCTLIDWTRKWVEEPNNLPVWDQYEIDAPNKV